MWRVALWGEGEDGEGGTVKDDGVETHSQQDGHKGALFLQESYAGNEREGLLLLSLWLKHHHDTHTHTHCFTSVTSHQH